MRLLAFVLMAGAGGCGFSVGCPSNAQPPAAAAPVDAGMPHGDHSPHHGGVVMMNGDLHYEIVLDPAGRYRVYFTDAARADLPAATAARVSITVARPGETPEGITLQIDDSGESWVGQGRAVADPAATTARIAYTIRGEEPYWIDLPFDAKPTRSEAHQ